MPLGDNRFPSRSKQLVATVRTWFRFRTTPSPNRFPGMYKATCPGYSPELALRATVQCRRAAWTTKTRMVLVGRRKKDLQMLTHQEAE